MLAQQPTARHTVCLSDAVLYTRHYTEAKKAVEKQRDDVQLERDHYKSTLQYYENLRVALSKGPAAAVLCDSTRGAPSVDDAGVPKLVNVHTLEDDSAGSGGGLGGVGK